MVHVRLNEKTENPNPHINFIAALPGPGQDDSLKLLRAVAAQLKPVMKAHGFTVNSLEEYECNKVFLGRNWNAGETVELVLRRSDGAFWPIGHLIAVFCHELSHIKHMNHLPAFHKLRIQLEDEVSSLRSRGYFGDGMYSSGQRLGDSEMVGPDGSGEGGLPEYICGGAQQTSRSQTLSRPRKRRRRPQADLTPSLHTGAQTAKKRKAGARITSAYAFGPGAQGHELVEEEEERKRGGGYRKQAGSRSARDQRAQAAERRLALLDASSSSSKPGPSKPRISVSADGDEASSAHSDDEGSETEDADSDDGFEEIKESDADRRRLTQKDGGDGDGEQESLKKTLDDWFTRARSNSSQSGSASSPSNPSTSSGMGSISNGTSKAKAKAKASVVEKEIYARKTEALGLNTKRTLGAGTSNLSSSSAAGHGIRADAYGTRPPAPPTQTPAPDALDDGDGERWACGACTLLNHPDYALCSVCGTRRAR